MRKPWVRDERELKVMEQIVTWRKQGRTFEEIYWNLRKRKVFTRKGVEWSLSRIKSAHKAAVNMHEEKAAKEKEVANHE